jgi:hypothetical protein
MASDLRLSFADSDRSCPPRAEAERTRLAEARERALAAQRRARREEAEANRRQAQLAESLRGWQEALSESGEGGAASGTASDDVIGDQGFPVPCGPSTDRWSLCCGR